MRKTYPEFIENAYRGLTNFANVGRDRIDGTPLKQMVIENYQMFLKNLKIPLGNTYMYIIAIYIL